NVKPLEHQLRPKGLGLGADRSLIRDLEEPRPQRALKPGEERKVEEPTGLVSGSLVQIINGPHQSLYGKIEGLDPDNARVLVKLALGGKVVTVSQYNIQFSNKKEYERYSKDLSRLSKAHQAARQREENQAAAAAAAAAVDREPRVQQDKEAESSSGQERRREGSYKDQDRAQREKPDRKRKHQEHSDKGSHKSKERKSLNGSSETALRESCWLRRDLYVRIIDKHYKGGKYYNSKVTIEDVLSYDSCVCRTEEGRLLEGIRQSMLETVIPKRDSEHVLIVLGRHKGQVGRVLRRDKDHCQAVVQLQRGDEQVLQIDYDSICQYVGGTDNDD
ncbi:G-patch domain and KOW motifs-containing protein, partial [Cetorhinus maximus]